MIIWLASYPRSGNTFLRVILNHAFGLKTYSLYNDVLDIGADKDTAEIVGHQFLAPDFNVADAAADQNLWLIKTHGYPSDDGKAIYIVRDGRETLVSYLSYLRRMTDNEVRLRDLISGVDRFGSWSDHLIAWWPIQRPGTLLLRFEDLTVDPERHLTAIAEFLGRAPLSQHIPTFAELQAVNKTFFRSGRNDTWKTVFTDEDSALFWSLHGDMMARYGYTDGAEPARTTARAAQESADQMRLRSEALILRAELRRAQEDNAQLRQSLAQSEADRAARLEIIERQGAELGRIHKLEADVAYLKDRLIASEADRAARLEVIQSQEQRVGALVAEHAAQLAEARSLLAQANIRTRIGIVVPHEIKRVRQLIDCTIQRLVSPAQADGNGGAAAAASVDVSADSQARGSPSASNGADAIQRIRDPKTIRPLEYNPEIIARIVEDLRARGFRVEELTLDPKEYRAYFEAADYTHLYSNYYTFNLPEKTLEHFIAAKMLELSPSDTYIDIASEHSPVPDIYTRLFGCVSYRQDLAYPAGLNDDRIGGDAAAMPVSDGFATKMALHCSFEHFEGESDMRFIREAKRVLRGGGRVCFAPLYLYHEYAILTDPAVAEQVPFEDDAVVYCKPGWHNRHGRFYDPLHLDRRIRSNLGTMQLTIYRVLNAAEIDPSCYIQFAAMITKP